MDRIQIMIKEVCKVYSTTAATKVSRKTSEKIDECKPWTLLQISEKIRNLSKLLTTETNL